MSNDTLLTVTESEPAVSAALQTGVVVLLNELNVNELMLQPEM